MPLSQFTIYTATDPQGPGYITGTTGSLINILDACLVDGYGTGSYYKAPAGWTKPFPNSSSLGASAPSYGCWRQGGGTSMSLFMSDMGLGVAGGGAKEAWITGWETLSQVGPTGTGSVHVGVGIGQFPTPAQAFTYGYVLVRKSTSLDTTPRYWMIAADQTTMYMWIWSGDVNTDTCYHWMFGDFYSYAGDADKWRCSIYGRVNSNTGGGQSVNSGDYDYTDTIPASSAPNGIYGNYATVRQPGHYVPRNAFGSGTSINYTKRGDSTFIPYGAVWYTSVTQVSGPMYGILAGPNGADNSYYFSPLEVVEPAGGLVLRGKLRGLYYPAHTYTTFANGQVISGSGDFAGRVFQMVRLSYCGSVWALEISPTVETN